MNGHLRKLCIGAITLGISILPAACGEELLGPTDDRFTQIYENSTFQMCADCHAPGAAGFRAGTEATQDWSSRDAAFESLKGTASGLILDFEGCNGVPLIGETSSTSLLVAVFDEDVRMNFSVPGYPDCIPKAIPNETILRVGDISPDVLQDLKDFIDDGGFR